MLKEFIVHTWLNPSLCSINYERSISDDADAKLVYKYADVNIFGSETISNWWGETYVGFFEGIEVMSSLDNCVRRRPKRSREIERILSKTF